MDKPTTLIALTFLLMALTACGTVAQSASPALPSAIQDPLLLEAWTRLNNQTEPVQLWDGRAIRGHDLAQFVLDNAIPVEWDSESVCGGSSCTPRACIGESCSMDINPGVDPIYIRAAIQTEGEERMADLVDTLAHEIFHYTLPYGPVKNTLYEEYSAFFLGAQISGARWIKFEEYNPLNPACLVKWFNDNHLLEGYERFKAYPASALASVDTSSSTCPAADDSAELAAPNSPLTCALSLDGSAICQFPPAPTPTPEYRVECTTEPSGLKGCKTVWLTETPAVEATPSVP